MSELDKHARAGIEAINANRLNEAIAHLQAALSLDDSRPDLNNALGMTFLRRGDAANGLPYLKRAVELAEPYNQPEHQEMRQHFIGGHGTTGLTRQRLISTLKDAVRR